MKNIFFLLPFCVCFLFACGKKEGPQGPQGPEGNANVRSATFQLASADWKAGGRYAYQISPSSRITYHTRFHEINNPAITTEILEKGAVLVYFKPEDNSGWTPLPFSINNATNSFSYNYVPQLAVGKLTLHYFWMPGAPGVTLPSNLSTYEIPTQAYRYVIISGSVNDRMKRSGIDVNNALAVQAFLQKQ